MSHPELTTAPTARRAGGGRLLWLALLLLVAALPLFPNGTALAAVTTSVQPVSAPVPMVKIACPSSTACYAVTFLSLSSGDPGVTLLTIDGGRITAGTTVTPGMPYPVTLINYLDDIACPSTNACYVAGRVRSDEWGGEYGESHGFAGAVGAIINSGGTVSAPDLHWIDTTAGLYGITCPSANVCYAVGEDNDSGVVVTIDVDGDSVSPGDVKSVPGSTSLRRIACPSSTECYAVGLGPSGAVVAALDIVDGTAQSGTAQVVMGTSSLYDIACPSASACYLAGTVGSAGAVTWLAVDGSTIIPQPVQTIEGASDFSGIACSSPSTCYAVGYLDGDDHSSSSAVMIQFALINTYMTIQPVAGAAALSGIACPADTCYAVGYGTPVSQGVVATIAPQAVASTTTTLSSSATPSVYGQAVTFTATVAPTNGAGGPSGTVQFAVDGSPSGGPISLTAASGQAQATLTVDNLPAGSHTITATYSGDGNFATSAAAGFSQTVNKAALTITADDQSIAYGADLPPLTYTPGGFVNRDTADVLDGSPSLSTTAAGSAPGTYPITIGPGTLHAANYTFTFVDGTLTINHAGQTISFTTPDGTPSYTYGTDSGFTVGATASSGLPVSFSSTTTDVCIVSGTTVSIVGAGTCTITASQAGDAGTAAAPDVSRSFPVAQAGQTISFPVLADTTYGAGPITLAATASSGLAVDYTASGPCSVSGAVLSVTGAGICMVTAHQPGATDYLAAPDVQRSFAVAKATLTISADDQTVAYGAGLPTLTYTPSGFVNRDTASALSGAPSLVTTARTGSAPGEYPITISPGSLAAANYSFAFADGTLTITRAGQTITFPELSNVAYGAAPLNLAASASSGLPVIYTASGPCAVSGATLTITGAGTCVVTAHQSGDGTYLAAEDVSWSVTIAKAPLTITAADQQMRYHDPVPALTVTYSGFVNGDGPATLTTPPACSTTATSSSPVGTYPISCNEADSPNYAISYVPGTLTVNQSTPVVSWAAPTSIVYGTPLGDGQLNATASVPGSFAYEPAAGTILDAGLQTLRVTFTPADATNYTTATAQVSLTVNPAPLTITATDQAMLVGGPRPALTWTGSGWANGDGPSALTAQPTCMTTATTSSPVGTYPITCSEASDPNYDITYHPGTVTVTYGVTPLYDQDTPMRQGLWAFVKFQLVDGSGHNRSSRELTVMVLDISPVDQPWNGEQGTFQRPFVYNRAVAHDGGYQLVFNTGALSPGTYVLSFQVEDDPMIHTLRFIVAGR